MKYHGYSVSDAIIHVRKERPIINPNPGFLTYLFRYERKATEKDWIVRTKLFEQLHFSDSKSTIYWGPESFPHLNINKEFSRLNIRYCWLFGVPLCFAPDDASISYTSIFPTNINIYAVFCQFSKTLNKILGGGNSICVCSAQGYGIIDVFIAFYLYRFHKRSFESLKSMVPTKDSEETLDQLIKTHSNVARRTKSH